MTIEDIPQRGKELRSEIEATYKELRSSNKLVMGVRGNDITEIAEKFIPRGTSFDSAEEILRSAGFTVYPRPGVDSAGNRPDRHDVSAFIKSLDQGFFSVVEVIVSLSPKAPGDYGEVNKISAGIFCTSL